jgi:preprotein translocase subunit SecD
MHFRLVLFALIGLMQAPQRVYQRGDVVPLYFATPRFSLRAASVEPVDGWQTMRVEHCQGERCTLWVSPTVALTESDIEQAQPEVSPNGDSDTGLIQRVRIVLTDVGAKKLHDLTEAQLRKHIALIVDEKVLWAPTVNGVPGRWKERIPTRGQYLARSH